MIPLAALLAALLWVPGPGPGPGSGQTGPAGLRAAVTGPQAVEVGAPFDLSIELEHASAARPVLLPEAVGEAWVVLAEHGAATRPAADGRATTLVRWTVCALEPLEAGLPGLMASFADGSLEAPFVLSGGIDVQGVLAPGEDQARPPHGFRAAPAAGRPGWLAWLLGLAGAAFVALGLLALRRRAARAARAARAPAPATPLERLAAIDPRALTAPAAVQGAYYELTAAVRGGIDARVGADRSGCTDEEWLRALGSSAELSEEERDALEDLLRSSAAVKYGGSRPTHWAAQEALDRARAVLDGSLRAPAEVSP